MKKILLIAIGLTLFSCSTPELYQSDKQPIEQQSNECGTILKVLLTPDGAELYIQFESEIRVYTLTNQTDKTYSKGDIICDFTDLVRIK